MLVELKLYSDVSVVSNKQSPEEGYLAVKLPFKQAFYNFFHFQNCYATTKMVRSTF